MRAILLLIAIAVTVPLSLFRPAVGICAYIWFGLMSADDLAFIAGRFPLSQVLAIGTIIGLVANRIMGLFALVANPICIGLVFTCVSMAPSVLAGPDTATTADPYFLYVRVVGTALLIPALLDTFPGLRAILMTFVFSIGALGAKVGLSGLLHGGAKYANGYGYGPFVDNNFLALGFAMAVPLCWYGSKTIDNKWLRWMLQVMAVLDVCAVVWTYSRGAAISVAIVLMLISLQSKHRVLMLALIVCTAGVAVYLVKDTYLARMNTIQTPLEEESARSRVEYAQAALKMWSDHPVFGVGFGTNNFRTELPKYLGREASQVAHNTYLQILADSGALSFLCHVVLVWGTTIWLFVSARRIRDSHPGMENYPLALGTSMVAFAVGSTFISIVKFELYHAIIMAAAVWYTCYRKLLAEDAMAENPWLNSEARVARDSEVMDAPPVAAVTTTQAAR